MSKLTYTVAAFCEAVGLGRTKTYELINNGTLRTIKVGRRTLICADSVNALLAAAPGTERVAGPYFIDVTA